MKQKINKYGLMVWELAFSDFKLRDQGTFLGFLWTLLYPAMHFCVIYIIFVDWMRTIKDFPLYMLIGMCQWHFFAGATATAISSILRYRSFVKSINFPKECIVYASVLSVLFSYILELTILILFCIFIKGLFSVHIFLLIPIILLIVYLTLGISLLLALIGVYFLDMVRIWSIIMAMGFFLTPIFYSLEMLSPVKRNIILLNPMTHIIEASRDILIYGQFPKIAGLLYTFIVATVFLVIGYTSFKKFEGYFVEKIQ